MTDGIGAVRFVDGPSGGHVARFEGDPPEWIEYDTADGERVRYVYHPQAQQMRLA